MKRLTTLLVLAPAILLAAPAAALATTDTTASPTEIPSAEMPPAADLHAVYRYCSDMALLGYALKADALVDPALEGPQRVQSRIASTRALDGVQEDSWDDYTAHWTYHPDDGVNITIYETA